MSFTAISNGSVDSSPKWFTEIDIDLRNYWSDSSLEHVTVLHYDDSAFTRVVVAPAVPAVTPYATPGASASSEPAARTGRACPVALVSAVC